MRSPPTPPAWWCSIQRYTDRATWLEPQRYAEGVRFLLVNGALAVDDGVPTVALAGRVVRRLG